MLEIICRKAPAYLCDVIRPERGQLVRDVILVWQISPLVWQISPLVWQISPLVWQISPLDLRK